MQIQIFFLQQCNLQHCYFAKSLHDGTETVVSLNGSVFDLQAKKVGWTAVFEMFLMSSVFLTADLLFP